MNPCCCCLLRLPEKDLKTPYVRCGMMEIFSDMLQECFQIHLILGNEDEGGICEVCAGRLRDARDFKLQVQRSQAELERQHVKNDENMDKSEMSGDDNTIDIIIEPCTSVSKLETTPLPAESAQPASTTVQLATTCSESPNFIEAPYHCQICPQTFVRESTLKMHMTKMHDNFAISPGPVVSTCETFEQQFTKFCLGTHKPQSLRRVHKQIHKRKKDHSCDICRRKFKKKYLLTAHIRRHTGEKPFSCEVCNKKFTTNSCLTSHNRLHTGGVFICDACGKRYTRKSQLIIHINVHSGEKPYECEICNTQFTYQANLRAHYLVHSHNKCFACDVCGKRFRRKDHLTAHNLTHTGKKPFSCDICKQKFSTKSYVKQHNRKVHAKGNI